MSLREFTTAPPRPPQPGEAPPTADGGKTVDPLRYCIFTTLGLLAWLVGPALVVTVMSALGLAAYWTARRAGVMQSRCVLGDTRLVIAYLATAFVAGLVGIAIRL
jgi:hypothetical protein